MDDLHRRYMLDTNMASYIIKGKPDTIKDHLHRVPMSRLCVSAITEAELLHGVMKNPEAKRLPVIVNEFLLRVNILPWDSNAAKCYAQLRTDCQSQGFALGAMDMLIAAHSISVDAILVTHDQAFYNLTHLLALEDWTQ